MFYLKNPVPCLHNEPYYDGLKWGNTADLGSDLAAYYSRVALYGSVLSGGLAGHVYGTDHIWDGNSEMPGSFLIQSAEQMQHIYKFLFSEGTSYQDLMPDKKLLEPHLTLSGDKNMGWAYCMHTESKDLFMLYFEKDCPTARLNGVLPGTDNKIQWFEPDKGSWMKTEMVVSDREGKITLPDFPAGSDISKKDWAIKLTLLTQ